MKVFRLLAAFWFVTWEVSGQDISIASIEQLPFPDTLISSECYMTTEGGQLFASILSAQLPTSTAKYFTSLYARSTDGKWSVRSLSNFPQAADPWIASYEADLLVSDISEGNRFHLKTEYMPASGKASQVVSHGLGHDHSMIIRDPARELTYLVSTIREGSEKFLYVAVSEDGGRTFKKYRHTIFRNVDFNAKQPVVNSDGTLLVPVVVRGSIDHQGEVHAFTQMNTWLYPITERGSSVGQPAWITGESGGKHHHLVAGDGTLHFVYSNIQRSAIEITTQEPSGTWSSATTIASGDWVNLDATLYGSDLIWIAYTERIEENRYHKYLVTLNGSSREVVNRMEVGPVSEPDDGNGWVKRAWPQGGDYCGLVNGDNAVYLLWSHPVNGLFKPHLAEIEIR